MVVCFTTQSVAHNMQRRMIGRLVNNELERRRKEVAPAFV
jgi:hypothetical protein